MSKTRSLYFIKCSTRLTIILVLGFTQVGNKRARHIIEKCPQPQ